MNIAARIHGTGYEAIIAMLLANFLAQLIKFFRDWRSRGHAHIPILFSTGGMPSSHSSTVTSLSTSIGLIAGWDSPVFAVAVCLAFIIMFDAAGLRQSASLQAQALNQIVRELMAPDHNLNRRKLKEFLGHTPREVLAGGMLGIVVSLGVRGYLIFIKP
jgi:uncharacterized protein